VPGCGCSFGSACGGFEAEGEGAVWEGVGSEGSVHAWGVAECRRDGVGVAVLLADLLEAEAELSVAHGGTSNNN
jgi:hypothetical protein